MSDLEILSAPRDEKIDTGKINVGNIAPNNSGDKYISAREIVQDTTSSLGDSRLAGSMIIGMITQKGDEIVVSALKKIDELMKEAENDYEQAFNEKLKIKN